MNRPSRYNNENSEHSKKTRLCNRWNSPTGCPFGSRCNYAHGISDIARRNCTYGDNCYKIVASFDGTVGGYANKDDQNPCCFKHPGEDNDQYVNRMTTDDNLAAKVPPPPIVGIKRPFDDGDTVDEYVIVDEKNVLAYIKDIITKGTPYIKIKVEYASDVAPMDVVMATPVVVNDPMDVVRATPPVHLFEPPPVKVWGRPAGK